MKLSNLKKSISFLGVIQIVQFVVPLFQLPYLSRVIGIDSFGLYMFSVSLLYAATIIGDFGLGVYLPQKVALNQNNKYELSKIFCGISCIKFILCFPAIGIYMYISSLYKGSEVSDLFFLLMIMGLCGNIFSLAWLFQGCEDLKYYAYLNLVVKLLGMGEVFLFVKSPLDINVLAFIFSLQFFFIATISHMIALHRYNLSVIRPGFSYVKDLIRVSAGYFVSRVFVSLYTVCGSVYLGVYGSAQQIAFYGAAEQLYKAGQQVFFPFSQALYPYMVRTKNYIALYKVIALCLCIACSGALFGFLAGEEILSVIFGFEFEKATQVLNVFMITIVISSISLIIGYPALSPLGLGSKVNISVVIGGLIQLIILCGITFLIEEKTAVIVALSILICELFVFIFRGYFFVKKVLLK